VLAEGTVNKLQDGATYTMVDDEDQKAALFSEGQIIFSGTGTLNAYAVGRAGIRSDDYIRIRPGVNIYVNSTALDGIRANDGIIIDGGVINVETTGNGAKGLRSEGPMTVNGGRVTAISHGDTRITTEDGTTTYLTGTYNPDFFPPYYFTTAAIRGEAGKRYHLTVDWRNHHAEGTTAIPASVPIDDIWSGPCSDSDTLRQVFIRFHDRPVTHDYYLLFSRREGEPVNPQLCMFGLIDDVTLPQPEVTMSVRRGGLITEYETYTPYYSVGDDVEVSLLHVDSTTYAYWRGYADSKELGFSLLFNVTTPLDGNILGGHGIWYGCGMGRETLNIKH
jgi:hypothetical protein